MKPDGSVEPFHKIMEEETMKRGKRVSVAQITQINKIIKYHSSATNDKDDENTDVNRLNGWANTQEDADIDRKYPTTHQQPLGSVHTNLPGQTRGGDSDNGGGENKKSPKNDGGEVVNTYNALAVPATCPPEVHDTTSEGLMVPRRSIVIQNREKNGYRSAIAEAEEVHIRSIL
ncbi:hypothetical protein Pmar_PMAR014704 [Perkinsus marinus ATCC 50983]|uniref:Uncharacterized protein n=1 Tax=Perkinsus marinus (strain ATCC 50983 / TXsc) TaxID=423536 RepID=C5LIT2_PERM5|nr:hypothetical protein Pmar_PMAR014704 [Perkinsus marinus ATCC 50983]EER03485.1 hypothetical protein Pmar_PMAR014704 [Perkinsus marinus ATCC 50983]|eukprot:XP_002771669.1 hypothetical protein Pmar_PMAR014704 [Perkinsus marinus ATCC 50983]